MRLGLTNNVAIHAVSPCNRDQMSEQTSFDALHIFASERPRLTSAVCVVVADQHFTKSVHRLARTYMLSQPVHSGGKLFAASIPRNPTIVHVTHYVLTCAGLQCNCSASVFIALCRIISTSTRK